MKQPFRRFVSWFAVYSAAATLAQAHPGHPGHEGDDFIWDFNHLVSHPLASLGFAALLTITVWAAWNHLRNRRSETAHNLRASADKRGK